MADIVDTWAKAIAQRISRRQLLGGAGAVAAGAVAAGAVAGAGAGTLSARSLVRLAARAGDHPPAVQQAVLTAATCPSGDVPCGPICCAAGETCRTIGAFPVCSPTVTGICNTTWHQQWCPGPPPACVDVLNDPDNCGSCAHRCPPPPPTSGGVSTGAAVCVSGACEVACLSGYTACQSSSGSWSCVQGECPVTCSSPQTLCGGICVNLATNSYNCGSCGHVCPAPANATGVCSGGECTGAYICDYGYTNCGTTCNNLATDVNNCGACGNACATSCPPPSGYTPYCAAGVCENIEILTAGCA